MSRDAKIFLPRGIFDDCMSYQPKYVGQLALCLDKPFLLVATYPLRSGGWEEIPIPEGEARDAFREFYSRGGARITW